MATKNYTESTLLPKDTVILDGTIYYKNTFSPTSYVGPLTISEFENDYGISMTTFNDVYPSFEEIEFTDIELNTGLNSVTYPQGTISYIKFDVQYPNNDIKTIIFRFIFLATS
jgi:hypothetical protein